MRIGRTNLLSKLSEFRLALLVGIVGSGALFVSLISYYLATSRAIVSPVIDEQLQVPAMATLTAFLLGLGSIVYGMHILFHQEWRRQESGEIREGSKFAILVRALCSRPYNILFATSALLYGVLFALVSGTLVYQPTLDLSEGLSAPPPSAFLVTCCDPLGQTPRLVVYMTSHLGLLLVPLNILLLAGTSWMVGANVSLAGFAYKTKASGGLKWLGSFGATTGLLTACPTCASLVLLGAAGGGDALAALLTSAQPALVAGTISLLSANLVLMTRKLRRTETCPVPAKD
jgi:hypothetical protein